MNRTELPGPMTCEQARSLFGDLIKEGLGPGQKKGVRDHLLDCEACSDTLVEAIDQALAEGLLPPVDVPPLRIPVGVPQVPLATEVLGKGEVLGVLWAGAREVATGKLDELRRLVAATRRWWPGLQHPPDLALAYLSGETIRIEALDGAWERTERFFPARVEIEPVFSAHGEFHLTVTFDDHTLGGKKLICEVDLVEGQAIRFETEPRATDEDGRWIADFHAEGLPRADEDTSVPLERLRLYAVPDEVEA